MIRRLDIDDDAALQEALEADPEVNLFLIGFLNAHRIDRAWWYGVVDPTGLRAVALVLPARLVVPYAPDPRDARDLGGHLRNRHPPCLLVGPREACDAIWSTWAPGIQPKRRHDQRLYVLRVPPPGSPFAGFRRARFDEWRAVAQQAREMELEDTGRDPAARDPALHAHVVQDRIQAGRTWVIEQDGALVFQINVGTTTSWGCQIGGTWVPHAWRGKGLATAGTRELCRRLLRQYPMVTLHVNEANVPAVRVYEKCGFQRSAAYRLITVAEA